MSAAPVTPPRKTWSREEIDTLDAAGLLAGTRFELIEGEVYDKMGQNPRHSFTVSHLAGLLVAIFTFAWVRIQMPVEPAVRDSAHSLPQPDIAITRVTNDVFRERHPTAEEVWLIAEISDTTLAFDSKRKSKLYARAGYPEYLVVDLNDEELLVHRSPRGGVYSEIRLLRPGDSYIPNGSDCAIAVEDVFREN